MFGSSHFNGEPVRTSVAQTNVFTGSIRNVHTWIHLPVPENLASSRALGLTELPRKTWR